MSLRIISEGAEYLHIRPYRDEKAAIKTVIKSALLGAKAGRAAAAKRRSIHKDVKAAYDKAAMELHGEFARLN